MDFKVLIVYTPSPAIYVNMDFGNEDKNFCKTLLPYAQNKLVLYDYALMLNRFYGARSLGLRFFDVYGLEQNALNPHSRVISIFIDRIIKNWLLIFNGGSQTRDFIFVNNVIAVLKYSMKYLRKNQVCESLNVDTGKSIFNNHLFVILGKIFFADLEIIFKYLPKRNLLKSVENYIKIKNISGIDIA